MTLLIRSKKRPVKIGEEMKRNGKLLGFVSQVRLRGDRWEILIAGKIR